jgi:2-polyprenyl-3-methyl-5-hydroxy-6-metoxy-1,4-benzoquinol methylase
LASDLGLFGEQLLAVLKDATHGFQQILKEADLFHKLLRLHLACLERHGM